MANNKKKPVSPLLRASILGTLIRATSKPKGTTRILNLDKEAEKMDKSGKYFGENYRKLTKSGRLYASNGDHGINVRKPAVYNGKPAKVIDAKYDYRPDSTGKPYGWDYLVEVRPGTNAWVGNTVKNIKRDRKRKS